MADTTQNNELAIMHAKLDQIIEANAELKEDFKTYQKTSDNKLTELAAKISKNEQDIQLLELKLQHLEALHKSDMERTNKKWDIPNKILITVLTAVATAIIALILK